MIKVVRIAADALQGVGQVALASGVGEEAGQGDVVLVAWRKTVYDVARRLAFIVLGVGFGAGREEQLEAPESGGAQLRGPLPLRCEVMERRVIPAVLCDGGGLGFPEEHLKNGRIAKPGGAVSSRHGDLQGVVLAERRPQHRRACIEPLLDRVDVLVEDGGRELGCQDGVPALRVGARRLCKALLKVLEDSADGFAAHARGKVLGYFPVGGFDEVGRAGLEELPDGVRVVADDGAVECGEPVVCAGADGVVLERRRGVQVHFRTAPQQALDRRCVARRRRFAELDLRLFRHFDAMLLRWQGSFQ